MTKKNSIDSTRIAQACRKLAGTLVVRGQT